MKQRIRIIAIAVLVLAAVAVVLRLTVFRGGRTAEVSASGTVEITEADLGFQRPGRIDSIGVQEGDEVVTGQELAWLDRSELDAQRGAAQSHRAGAAARLAELEAGYRTEEVAQAREALRAARERETNAAREAERARRLFDGGAISERARDAATTALEIATADRAAASERLDLLERGSRKEQIAAQRAMLAQATAALAQVDAALQNAVIRAPFEGRVTVRHREPGETVAAGMPVVTVANPADRWIRIYVPEDEVGRLVLGQAADIAADAFPDRRYTGSVVFIADEAEFTPRSVQTAKERVKLVYRVKVQLTGDSTYDLKPGLPADVRLRTATQ
jgi:HlyD family secretion protein